MSYKHNNLMAMRQNYWDDAHTPRVHEEKLFFQRLLNDLGVFEKASLEDAKSLFFSLPSIILIKGYAKGFTEPSIQQLITQHIELHRNELQQKFDVKIKFRV
ncbi:MULTISPECIES: hypothetical protein [Acinetobacter]|uniref:Uncharacterized protein n=1 Tax=Acinetobacter chengduensis TaxID=2420890 RepID=A0ABX9U026_9GAMM|nr:MULTISPECIES: hypothetical protein [Acinetobacter]MBI1452461.1 hypothetical protein [Acinetobacter sp. FL51]RKG44711.1 hypothetical protein D7V31_00480 [Acinetobacter sp. WCHAc060007]RLL23474.1 hypothetical protein D9K81_03605 [Acinetobacter chengduensis]